MRNRPWIEDMIDDIEEAIQARADEIDDWCYAVEEYVKAFNMCMRERFKSDLELTNKTAIVKKIKDTFL